MESLRVYYVERQRLSAADLQAEQEYLAGLDERHNLCQHGPGVVRGLSLGVDGAGRYWVEPGVAVDSRGRVLLLARREQLTIEEAAECADVWLVYCRQPLRLRQLGRSQCPPDAFQRWTEIPRVFVSTAVEGDDPVPPADGAVFLGRVKCEAPRQVAYTALRGGEVTDPGGRALMQVGPRAALDPESFVLSVADAADSPARRIVIDRRGHNSLSGTLELLGHYETLVVPVPRSTAFLLVEPAKLGQSVKINLEWVDTSAEVEITMTFEHAAREVAVEEFKYDPSDPQRADRMDTFNRTSNLARISLAAEFPPLRGQTTRAQIVSAGQQSALTSWAGTLELGDWPERDDAGVAAQAVEVKYGCYDAAAVAGIEGSAEPTGLSFRPVSEPPKGAPLPRIYTARATAGERTVEQLRLDLGEKKDIDFTERLTIGAWPGDQNKFTALSINGKCRLSLASENETVPDNLLSVMVTGSVEQTIKPDPTDPLFASLLVAAWMYGLRSSALATTNITVTIEDLPNPLLIETRKPWNYKVRLHNGEAAKVTADRMLETLQIAGQIILNPRGENIEINPNEVIDIPINHSAGEIPAGDLDIEILISGNVGRVPWLKTATKLNIPVVETPEADLSDVPDTVPPSSAWDHTMTVRNLARRNMTLLEVRRTEGPLVEQLLAAPADLPAQQSRQFGPFAHPAGITKPPLPVNLFVRYRWENGPEETVTSETKVVRSETQLRTTLDAPDEIEVEEPWEFSLAFENSSTQPIRLRSLRQRLRSAPAPDPPFQEIIVPADPINPGDILPLDDIPGIEVADATTPVTLELRAEYEHGGRTWQLPPVERAIDVIDPT